MDILKGTELQKASGESKPGAEALAGKKLVGIYFAVQWCPASRAYSPVLKKFYEELQKEGYEVEIVFVSSDRSPEEMKAFMQESHGDWYAVPHGADAVKELTDKFEVKGTPTLVFVKEDGSVERGGRWFAQRENPKDIFEELMNPPAENSATEKISEENSSSGGKVEDDEKSPEENSATEKISEENSSSGGKVEDDEKSPEENSAVEKNSEDNSSTGGKVEDDEKSPEENSAAEKNSEDNSSTSGKVEDDEKSPEENSALEKIGEENSSTGGKVEDDENK